LEDFQSKQQQNGQEQSSKLSQQSTPPSTTTTTSPPLPTAPKPQLTAQQQQQPPKTTPALVDKSFEDEADEDEIKRNDHLKEYNDLKSMYSLLMNGSASVLNSNSMLGFDINHDNDLDENYDDTNSELEVQNKRQFSNSNYKFDQDDDEFEDEDQNDPDYGPTKAQFKQQLLKGEQLLRDLEEQLKNDPHLTQIPTKSPKLTPPDPDEDWEYYNSRESGPSRVEKEIKRRKYLQYQQ
jgi:hypothetical protein